MKDHERNTDGMNGKIRRPGGVILFNIFFYFPSYISINQEEK